VPQRPSRVRHVVLLGLCLMAGLAYLHRGCLGVAETQIRGDLKLTTAQTGLAMGMFFWFYALFQIPTGLLVDRWGARKGLLIFGMMSAFTVALGAGTLLLGATVGLAVLIGSRALMGIAQAGLFPSATRCLATWFPVQRRAFASGVFQACMSLGAAIGSIITGNLLNVVIWPWIFMLYAIPGVIWSLWFFGWYRDRPEEHRGVNEAELELLRQPPKEKALADGVTASTPWLRLATRPKLIWLSLSQFFRAGANVFWLTWCPTFLQEVFKISKAEAGDLTAITFVGVVIGSLGGGWLCDAVYVRTGNKRRSRNGVAIITAAIGIGFFVLAWGISPGVYGAIAILFLAAIFAAGGNACVYSVTIDIGGKYMAVVFGAMNMFGNFGAALFSQILPPWTTALGWATVPLLMALLYTLGSICWWFVDPDGEVLDGK